MALRERRPSIVALGLRDVAATSYIEDERP
jgi:hypothetical protein